ncbi:MAG: aspartyl/asparaginyl beta-hydroxylase domain-containing protein [Sphingomonadales bacterium]|nr:aspartyl/asparaginyl beta-hydroxylase domain-containing protein [Sphingomonadales bacterium]
MSSKKTITKKMAQANEFIEKSQFEEGGAVLKDILKLEPDNRDAVNLLVLVALAQGGFPEAEKVMASFVKADPTHHQGHNVLGTFVAQQQRFPDAIKHFAKAVLLKPDDAKYYLDLGTALYMCDRIDDAVEVFSMAASHDETIRHLFNIEGVPDELQERSKLADISIRKKMSEMHLESVAAFEKETGVGVPRIKRSIWPKTHHTPFNYGNPQQQPTVFYVPELRDEPDFDLSSLKWVKDLEAAYPDIREEVMSQLDMEKDGEPYLGDSSIAPAGWSLKGNRDWTSLHLFQNASVTPFAKRFPKTVEALRKTPISTVDGEPIEVFFSILRPHTHIPPHFGVANNRLTVHMPIVIPEKCKIRVGDKQHAWEEGKLYCFDDSFEHEAWNDSDENRLVLIFETWHPDLADDECTAIERVFADRDAWLKGRNLPADLLG